ncbi:uncharacterized protein LOC102354461 [Latimeria chalumnae]|uniref:uncharacterized protein LOC102354461 n=1 Tax=Latimeria chalumnae TaxID=7897 RepID=UPI0003C19731|nr:PREDICTED: uncharacterized protein LOC102354461 [Latimeria chalumnae]XP_006008013.1 PREDICTED: uncharacterized protein LOC102354461 [Latimeria chalumnae]XP_014351261.1 PREDICTED: uncharacterized protein LOC102354461 [Latimeria chalumnae]|eukprot:XP_006008012.1 PREDICTED: uncharacterized protein LOC102354461 [Latimeria chalumnae]
MMAPETSFIYIALMWTLPYHMDSQGLSNEAGSQRTSQETDQQLLINEVNPDNPGLDTKEYVELYHTSGGRVSLDGYVMVLYNGNGNIAYKVLNLTGHMTNDKGFFLIGSSSVVPKPTIFLPSNTIQNGPDGIALYCGGGPYREGMKVTNVGLVDAIVHKSKKNDEADILLNVLTPGKEAFLEDAAFWTNDESIERCLGPDLQWTFQVAKPSPGKENFCSSSRTFNLPRAVINEVCTVASPDEFEFIELRGLPSTSFNGLVLVLMDGATNTVYFSMDIIGKTSSNGLFLVGPAGSNIPVNQPFPVNTSRLLFWTSPAAVALYSGDSSDFPPGTPLMDKLLIDALVYGKQEAMDRELLNFLTPRKSAFHQSNISLQGGSSISRCDCCQLVRDSAAYVSSSPTPGQSNDCPTRDFHQEITYCLKVTECSLWVPDSQISYDIRFSLAGNIENICSCGVSMGYIKDSSVSCQGAGLVFKALLIAKSSSQLQQLHSAFHTHVGREETIIIAGRSAVVDQDCLHAQGTTAKPSGSSSRSPYSDQSELLINELNADNPGSQEDEEYIELLHTARTANTTLDGYWLVLYNGNNNQAYKMLNLTGYQTGTGGYFLVGSARVSPKPAITLPPNTVQNGPDAVALYYSWEPLYAEGMLVTDRGLVDAMVYTSRGLDSVEGLLQVLTPGQEVLLEDAVVGTGDESLSRCHNLLPRNQISYQVTITTPLKDNVCLSSTVSPPTTLPTLHPATLPLDLPQVVINELNTANGLETAFIELRGPPHTNLSGFVVVLFDGLDNKAYATIPLQGLTGANGLFVIGSPSGIVPVPDQLLPVAVQRGPDAVALYYGNPSGFPVRIPVSRKGLVDSLVYTSGDNTDKELLDVLTPGYYMAHEDESSLGGSTSLSRCSCCEVNVPSVYAISAPTPGAKNDCPTANFSMDISLCLQTHNCTAWIESYEKRLHDLKLVLTRSIEDQCHCGISMVYLTGVIFTCNSRVLILSGKVQARSQEQLQTIRQEYWNFISRHQFIYVAGNQVGIDKNCSGPHVTFSTPPAPVPSPVQAAEKTGSLAAWEISVIVLGLLLICLIAGLGSLYYMKRRPSNYTTIEMNNRRENLVEF